MPCLVCLEGTISKMKSAGKYLFEQCELKIGIFKTDEFAMRELEVFLEEFRRINEQ